MNTLFGADARPNPDVASLIRAIREQPDEDTPRLILADWLQERGDDDFATFIRSQCELARLDRYTPEWWQAVTTAATVSSRNAERLSNIPELPGAQFRRFERGLPTVLVVQSPGQLRRMGALIEHLPLSGLGFRSVPNVDVLTRRPELRRVTRLRFDHIERQTSGLEELIWSGAVAGVRGWTFAHGTVDAARLPDLRVGVHRGWTGCSDLALRDACVIDDGESLLALLRLVGDGRLELDQGLNGAAALPELGGCDAAGVRATSLSLVRSGITDAAAAALADWPGVGSLCELSLAQNLISDDGFEALAGSRRLDGLVALSLRRCWVGDAGLRALRRPGALPALRLLDLVLTDVTQKACEAIRAERPGCLVLGADDDCDPSFAWSPCGDPHRVGVFAG